MSFWMHVNGSLRIDGLVTPEGQNEFTFLKNLFHTYLWGEGSKKRRECNVPLGSEESLQVSVYRYPNRDSDYTINFFGDLRDFEGQKEILDWINGIIKDNDMFVRDGIMTLNGNVYQFREKINDEEKIVSSKFELITYSSMFVPE